MKKNKALNTYRKRYIFIYGSIAWACIHFLVFWVGMNVGTIYNSFFTETVGGDLKPYGVEAYKEVFMTVFGQKSNGINDYHSILNTFSVFVLAIFINLPLTLLFSYMIFKKIKWYKVLRVGMYVPCVISVVVLCLFWRLMVSGTSSGSGSSIFALFDKMGYGNEEIIKNGLLTDASTAWPAIIIFSVWTGVNGNIIYFTSAMARLPGSVIESASLDGASDMKQFFSIVIPMIWPVITTMSITLIAGAINWFQPAQLIIGNDMAATVHGGTMAWMIVSQIKGGKTVGFPAAFGVTIGVFGAIFITVFRKLMEKIYEGVEY